MFLQGESSCDAGLSAALVKLTGGSGIKMALGSYPKLVMMTGPLYFHIDQWLGVATLERTAAKSAPEEADVWRLCTVYIENLLFCFLN